MSTLLVCTALLLGADSQAGFKPQTPPDVQVEEAARDFRIQVYQSFRRNRSEYDARRSQGDEMLQRWRKAKQPVDYRDVVVQWFEDAESASRGAGGELPEFPKLPDPPVEKALTSGNPTTAPHLPDLDRPGIDTGNPFADISGNGGDLDFLGQPQGVVEQNPTYQGPAWMPSSKILKSVQRALLVSATSPDDKQDSAGSGDSSSNDSNLPALNQPQNDQK